MLIRHARTRAPFSRFALFSTTSRIAKKSEGSRPSWLETKGRTQSFLFDEDNPVINKETYALHKVHLSKISTDADSRLKSVLDQEDVRSWQSNPYLSMLASPIRKCQWSEKVMPRDFLIPIKAALYSLPAKEASPKGKDVKTEGVLQQKMSIFPKGLLHPAFTQEDESKGKKESRAYVVCKKIALEDYSKTGAWKRLDHSAIPNPLLVYQIESQLRERVLQELKLLASPSTPHALLAEGDNSKDSEDARQGEKNPTPFLRILPDIAAAEIERTKTVRRALFHAHITEDADSKSTLNPPSALFDFSDPPSSEIIPEGQISALLPYITPELQDSELRHLAQHRVPIYSIPRLFQLDLGGPEIGSSAIAPKATSANEVETLRVPLWSALRRTRPDIYDREVIKIQKQRETFERPVSSLSTPRSERMQPDSLHGKIVAVPSMSEKVVPLLKALWRHRMWLGEGWSGDGFGVLQATGRKRPF